MPIKIACLCLFIVLPPIIKKLKGENKMKRTVTFLLIAVSVVIIPWSTVSSNANLSPTSENFTVVNSKVNSSETDFLTKYIKVVDNQFVLDLPSNVVVSPEVNRLAIEEVAASNEFVKENGLSINPRTLTAEAKIVDGKLVTSGISVRSYGKTGVLKVGWNYVRIGLDAGLTKDILTAGVAGAAGYLGFIAGGPTVAAIVAAVSGVVGNHVSNIKNGVWFDFNPLTKSITAVGRQ